MSAVYHKQTTGRTVFVPSLNGTEAERPTVREFGFSLAHVKRDQLGNVDQVDLRGELWMFLTNSQPGMNWWEFGHVPSAAKNKQPWDIDTRRDLLSWQKRADSYWRMKGVPSPVKSDFTRFTLPEYIAECGLKIADIDNQWMTPELAADLGFEVWELWPSLRNAAPEGIDEAIASAESFAVAIDCLPVGKDIRNRLQAHIQAHIDLLRRCAGDAV